MMQNILYEHSSIWVFLIITCLLGGGGAWMTGRACARSWRGYGYVIAYMFPLAAAVRFLHFALFQGSFLSLHYYAVDWVILVIIGVLGFRHMRTQQMVTQYPWLYEQTSPLSWRAK